MTGENAAAGESTTAGAPPATAQPAAPGAGVHGSIGLDAAACTSCNLCVTECPTWCITLTARTEEQPATTAPEGPSAGARAPRGRARKVKVLESFAIDYGLCMYCGICVEVCPFDALAWNPRPVSPSQAPEDLREGIAELGERWPG